MLTADDPANCPPYRHLFHYSNVIEGKASNERVKHMARTFRKLGSEIDQMPFGCWCRGHQESILRCHYLAMFALNRDSLGEAERIWVLGMLEMIEAWEVAHDPEVALIVQTHNTRRVSLELKAAKGKLRSPYISLLLCRSTY